MHFGWNSALFHFPPVLFPFLLSIGPMRKSPQSSYTWLLRGIHLNIYMERDYDYRSEQNIWTSIQVKSHESSEEISFVFGYVFFRVVWQFLIHPWFDLGFLLCPPPGFLLASLPLCLLRAESSCQDWTCPVHTQELWLPSWGSHSNHSLMAICL